MLNTLGSKSVATAGKILPVAEAGVVTVGKIRVVTSTAGASKSRSAVGLGIMRLSRARNKRAM
jgi:hypothetical protein